MKQNGVQVKIDLENKEYGDYETVEMAVFYEEHERQPDVGIMAEYVVITDFFLVDDKPRSLYKETDDQIIDKLYNKL